MTDAAGCPGGDYFDVFVRAVGLSGVETPALAVRLAPNPIVDVAYLTLTRTGTSGQPATVQIFNRSGQLIRTMPMPSGQVVLKRSAFEPGWYFYRVLQESQVVAQGSMAVE